MDVFDHTSHDSLRGQVSRMVTALSELSLSGRVSYSLGNTVNMDRHSTWQTHHVRLTEGVVAQVASFLFRHKDRFLPLFQLWRKYK